MQEARILHIEDSHLIYEKVEMILAISGLHRVVARAESLTEAEKQLKAIKRGRLDANVVLLDGNINSSAHLNHPKYIKLKMKELGVNIPIVGLSVDGLAEKGLVVGTDIDADLKKWSIADDLGLLRRTLDELDEPATLVKS